MTAPRSARIRKLRRSLLVSLSIATVLVASPLARADNTVASLADTWVAQSDPNPSFADTNYEANVNPSSQLRNSSVQRASLYQFELPAVGAHETVTGVEFRLEEYFGPLGGGAEPGTDGSTFIADLGVLNSNPNLTTITYNTAITDGFLQGGQNPGQNPVPGANLMLAGETWSVTNGSGVLTFSDNDPADGFAQLVSNAVSTTPTTMTMMTLPIDPTTDNTNAAFSGEDNSESNIAFPNPRLTVRKALTNVTDTLVATGDVFIASNDPAMNFEGDVNPSTQIRNNDTVSRAALFQFTLPQLGAGEAVVGAQLQLAQFFDGGHFSADFALLASNPDPNTITWNSAIAAGYLDDSSGAGDADNDARDDVTYNPILGANATAAGELWENFSDDEEQIHFTDGDASNGFAQLIANAASTSGPVDITLMMLTQGQEDLGISAFYGLENTDDQGTFFAHPRLFLTIEGGLLSGDPDFDNDNDVDGDDFLIWQRNFPINGGALNTDGDANLDGDVLQDDLAIWASQYGGPPTPLAAVSAVPEPTSLLMLLCGLPALLRRRLRRVQD